MIAVVSAVVFAGIQMDSTEKHVTEVYYDMLYNVNNLLVGADRDYHQSLLGATQYYDMINGFSKMPEELMGTKMPEKLSDYEENLEQTKEKVLEAADIAKTDKKLYNEMKAENGKSFEEISMISSL